MNGVQSRLPLVLITILLVFASLLTLVPFTGPLILAAWMADIARPFWEWMVRKLRWRGGAAAGVVTLLLIVVVVIPVSLVLVSLASSAVMLAKQLSASEDARQALMTVVSGDNAPDGAPMPRPSLGMAIQFMRENGTRAWGVLAGVLGATGKGVVAFVVFLAALYVFLANGKAVVQWLERNTPIPPLSFARLAGAFQEAGRGLFAGVVLTGLLQAAIATTTYSILGVPRPFVLGFVTFVASFVPSVGCAFVWVPVTVGLALSGRTGAAIGLAAVGVGVISTVDNVARPLLTKFGRLDMPVFLLLLVMIGGVGVFGGWGLVLGPLITRLAMEALRILQEEA